MNQPGLLFKRLFLSCSALVIAGVLVACGSSDDGGSTTGVMSVSLTDAPACGFDQVNVTVSKVRVHQSSSADDKTAGWTDIALNPPRKINLLDLNDPTQPNFALLTLGETPLTAGHYTQLRLVLVPNSNNPNQPFANSIVLSGTNNEIALDTPSGIQSGIKLIHQFDVGSGQRVDLLLDFDACKSVVLTGNGKYKLKPVIKVIPIQLNGINGFIDKTLTNVRVSAQQSGNIIRETVMNTQTGEFFLAHLDPGNYDVVITADNHATAVISGVPVSSSTSITTISTSSTPFTLPTSATQNINGVVTLNPADDDATVIVAAKQTLNPGPLVTVKSQVAALIAGNPVGDYSYALTLPTAAPLLAAFGPLPIIPTAAAQSAVAKMYTVQGSATTDTTVYTTQTPAPSAADITAVPTKNFTLTP